MRQRYPGFGPKKLCQKLDGRLHPRTASRILARQGLSVQAAHTVPEVPIRFEREHPNELWQVDFKGLKRRARSYEILSVVDDAARFCICLRAVRDLSTQSAWEALWDAFGEYGLPDAVLTDNGSAFTGAWTKSLSQFEVRLLRLGVRPIHGRPCHPQTQGKVERFHGTLQRDLGESLLQPSLSHAQDLLQTWREFYNWDRPHEAVGQRVPGVLYKASVKTRPSCLPEPEYPTAAHTRKVDAGGLFTYKGTAYKAGKGLIGERLGLMEAEQGMHVFFAQLDLGPLELFTTKVSRMSCPQL
jgi:transposase InsO family protein